MIKQKIEDLAKEKQGLEIPKPQAKGDFRIKGLGIRRGEPALIYTIPSHTGKKPYQKGIAFSEFEKAFAEMKKSGLFTKSWFDRHLPGCSKEGSCNFTSMGGIFQLLGVAQYSGRGEYKLRDRS